MWDVTFSVSSPASYISHELHHTYAWNCGDDTPQGGHLNDTNGNGVPDEADDFTRVLYNYNNPGAGYNSQDYHVIRYGRGTAKYISIR
jgi:hypothetical protein